MKYMIRRKQTHRAYVEQIDFYSLLEDQYQEYNSLPEEDKEYYLMEKAEPHPEMDSMDIEDLLETVDVTIEEVEGYDYD